MRSLAAIVVLSLAVVLFGNAAARAQEAEERSRFIRLVEDTISTPNMQIRLNGIEGTLSSDVSLASITIADAEGVWLTITEPRLVWNRSALLRGRLDIESLTAQRIDIVRGPLPEEGAPAPESRSFAIPQLPVTLGLRELDAPLIVFGEALFGLAAEVSVTGAIDLSGGSLDTNLAITRLDGPGGTLAADITYAADTEQLALDVALAEPENGLVANLLNLEGRPPVALNIEGDAPLDDLRVQLALDVAQKRILNGNLQLDGVEGGLRARADLGGPLATIVRAPWRDLMGEASRLDAEALFADDGRIRIDRFSLTSGVLDLTANARLLADGFLEAISLDASIADESAEEIRFAEGAALTSAQLRLSYDAPAGDAFDAELTIADLVTGDVGAASVQIAVEGSVANFDQAANRSVTFTTTGAMTGITARDAATREALGTAVTLSGAGSWAAGGPVQVSAFDVEGANLALKTSGRFADLAFDGQIGLETSSLAPFSQLAGRALDGSLGLLATGTIEPVSGAFDLVVNGVASQVSLDDPTLDALLEGSTTLSGGVARGIDGLAFDRLRVTNNQADILVDGRHATAGTALKARADLRDLANVSPDASGAANLTLALARSDGPLSIDLTALMQRGTLAGKPVEALTASFSGTAEDGVTTGALSGSGSLDGQPVTLQGDIRQDQAMLSLQGVQAVVGASRINADLTRDASGGLLRGTAAIVSSDISALAALALVEAGGALNADVKLTARDAVQVASVQAQAENLVVAGNRIGGADITAELTDLFGALRIEAEIAGRDIAAGGVDIRTVDGTVTNAGSTSGFDLTARLAQNDARLTASGTAIAQDGGQRIVLDALALTSTIANARLAGPTTLLLREGTVGLSDARVTIGDGSLVINGSAGRTLDLRVALTAIPLAIANAVRPDLQLAGTLSGTVQASGTASAPTAAFTISASSLSTAQTASFDVAPLSVETSGRFDAASSNLLIEALTATNAQDISVSGRGRVPLSGGSLDMSAQGTVPLAIAQRFVAGRGATLSGLARFDVTATGPLASPSVSGLLSVAGGTLNDPLSNLRLENIGVLAGLNGDVVNIRQFTASLASGGTVNGAGTIGLNAGLPADLQINLERARYTDGQTFATTVDGPMSLSGSLARDPLLAGELTLGATEIVVPETFGGNSELLDVVHVAPDQATSRTLQRIERVSPLPTPGARPSILQLEISVSAPNQIFVRGRGLDAELGGRIVVRGPITNVQPQGAFQLRRGRLNILGQRFDISEGTITILGDLDPVLDFTVTTQSGDVTAFINLSGRASDLQVTFSSSPELPQDEVLARIIFGRGLSQLSPTQIARLASVAFELTGGQSPGLVDGLREGLGLDDLDIVEDSDGNAAVRAGKYVSDNVYLGIETGQDTEATINLDITDSLTARGALKSDGDTSLGIFFERDY